MRQKTKEEKEMQGTYEPSKEGLEPVEYDEYERVPTAPKDWPPSIQKIWEDRCYDLKKAGYLVKAFMMPLKRYCFAALMAETAEAKLLEEGYIIQQTGDKGQVYEVMSPWLKVLEQANKTILNIGSKFGFTPLDVQKIPVVQKKIEEDSLLK